MSKPRSGSRDGLGWWARGRASGTEASDQAGELTELELFERLERPLLGILPYLMLVVSVLATALMPSSRPALPLTLILAGMAIASLAFLISLVTDRP